MPPPTSLSGPGHPSESSSRAPLHQLQYKFEWVESSPEMLAEEATLLQLPAKQKLPSSNQKRNLASPKIFPHMQLEVRSPSASTAPQQMLLRSGMKRGPPSTPPQSMLSKQLRLGETPNATWSSAATGSTSSSKTTLNTFVKADATNRHASEFYQMVSDSRRDNLILEILSTPAFRENLMFLRSQIGGKTSEKQLEAAIATLGNTFHAILAQKCGRMSPQQTKLISQGHRNIRNLIEDQDQISHEDKELNRLDVVVLDVPSRDNPVSHRLASPSSDQFSWKDIASFVEVKSSATEDCSDRLITQCLGYARKMFQYRLITSHLHFVTWCGPLVRLWYVDAELYGCSRVISVNQDDGLLQLGRILCLLTDGDEQAQIALYGRWNPFTQPPLSYSHSQSSQDSMCDAQATKPLDWLASDPPQLATKARPGPFGTRTVILQGRTNGTAHGSKTFIKCVWLPKHLVDHELDIQHGLQDMASTPNPRGPIVIPKLALDLGFKTDTARTPGRQANDEVAVCFTAFAYDHRLGHIVPPDTSEAALLSLHKQAIEQLRDYAERGYHYRDLNAGNLLIEKGTKDRLVLVDHGNARHALGVRGKRRNLRSALSTAQDDVRSTNTYFLPTCASDAKQSLVALQSLLSWFERTVRRESENEKKPAVKSLSGKQQLVPATLDAAVVRGCAFRRCGEFLLDLKKHIIEILAKSHRYIDDLESLLYLHLWQACDGSASLQTLEESLRRMEWKNAIWRSNKIFAINVDDLLGEKMSQHWHAALQELNSAIFGAEERLRGRLKAVLDDQIDLKQVKEIFRGSLEKADLNGDSGPSACRDLLASAFDGFADLGDIEALQPEERAAFEACIRLLQSSASQIQD